MNKNKLSLLICYLTFWLVVFYPFKGLISFLLSSVIGANVSLVIIRSLFLLVFCFVLLNLLANNFTLPSKADKILFLAGSLGLAIGVVRQEHALIYNTFLLFFLPVLFSRVPKINDAHFFKVIFMFFAISTAYMLLENIILHPNRFGLSFDAPSFEQYCGYTNYIVASKYDNAGMFIVDFRHIGVGVRTGGYLGHVLAMPVLLCMGATFFYVWMREDVKPGNLIFCVISVFVLVHSLSTTAVGAFVLTAIFYELCVRRNIASLGVIVVVIVGLFTWCLYGKIGSYVYERLVTNLNNPMYLHSFWNPSMLLTPQNILYLFIGKWSWVPGEGAPSHIDLINIVLAYGGIVSYIFYKRMLFPALTACRSRNLSIRTFSLTVLSAFICLFHSQATLNVNVMMLVTLLYLKAGAISSKLRDSHTFKRSNTIKETEVPWRNSSLKA